MLKELREFRASRLMVPKHSGHQTIRIRRLAQCWRSCDGFLAVSARTNGVDPQVSRVCLGRDMSLFVVNEAMLSLVAFSETVPMYFTTAPSGAGQPARRVESSLVLATLSSICTKQLSAVDCYCLGLNGVACQR